VLLVNIDNAHIRNRREPPTTSTTPARRRVNFNVRNLILHSGRVIDNDSGDNKANDDDSGYQHDVFFFVGIIMDQDAKLPHRATATQTIRKRQQIDDAPSEVSSRVFTEQLFHPTCRFGFANTSSDFAQEFSLLLQPTTEFLEAIVYRDDMLTAIHRNPDQALTSGMGYDADALSWWKSFSVKNCNRREHKHGETETAPLSSLSVSKIMSVLNLLDAGIGCRQESTKQTTKR
jgi:hypothetical protein